MWLGSWLALLALQLAATTWHCRGAGDIPIDEEMAEIARSFGRMPNRHFDDVFVIGARRVQPSSTLSGQVPAPAPAFAPAGPTAPGAPGAPGAPPPRPLPPFDHAYANDAFQRLLHRLPDPVANTHVSDPLERLLGRFPRVRPDRVDINVLRGHPRYFHSASEYTRQIHQDPSNGRGGQTHPQPHPHPHQSTLDPHSQWQPLPNFNPHAPWQTAQHPIDPPQWRPQPAFQDPNQPPQWRPQQGLNPDFFQMHPDPSGDTRFHGPTGSVSSFESSYSQSTHMSSPSSVTGPLDPQLSNRQLFDMVRSGSSSSGSGRQRPYSRFRPPSATATVDADAAAVPSHDRLRLGSNTLPPRSAQFWDTFGQGPGPGPGPSSAAAAAAARHASTSESESEEEDHEEKEARQILIEQRRQEALHEEQLLAAWKKRGKKRLREGRLNSARIGSYPFPTPRSQAILDHIRELNPILQAGDLVHATEPHHGMPAGDEDETNELYDLSEQARFIAKKLTAAKRNDPRAVTLMLPSGEIFHVLRGRLHNWKEALSDVRPPPNGEPLYVYHDNDGRLAHPAAMFFSAFPVQQLRFDESQPVLFSHWLQGPGPGHSSGGK
ncbi:hypothetical protein BCV70DRAFT_101824 [Testicularia cyperi]|uniref:Uncharacterized protein n=1 Tax=Testicularia cyperi TaxID=1882483 RepID=A0A317XGC3_9BASI|nr:hypothetical protein BCV70DRAFT_101824 [Testicularia cyperi]